MRERLINGVFFDLGWTLERPASGSWMLTNRFFDYVPRDVFNAIDETLRKEAMAHACRPLEEHHYTPTLEEEDRKFIQYFRDLNTFLKLGLSEEQIFDIGHDHTYNFSNYILFDSTIPTLKTLKEHGYRVGVISDTWPSTVPQQKEAGTYDYYDFLVLSFELGVLKPNPRMYETALEYMGLPAEQTIYVDDLTMSLDKAQTYGIHGVCSIADDPSRIVTNYPCVRHPGEVLDLLKEMNGGIL